MRSTLFYILTFIGLLLADQLSKWWMLEMFFRPRSFDMNGASQNFLEWLLTFKQEQLPFISEEITSFFNVTMVWNKGVSFGMFASYHDMMPIVLSIMALCLTVVLAFWFKRVPHIVTRFALVMMMAGAIGNVWDRVRFRAVADFIDFHVGDWHYPAFNIADCCIVVGVCILAFDGLVLERLRLKKGIEHA